MCNKFNTQVFVTGLRKKNLANKKSRMGTHPSKVQDK
jgi:hypothetical protein